MLCYGFDQGGVAQKIVEECRRFFQPVPEKILNAPELRMGLELYYIGFLDLNSCRVVAQAPGPIPFLSILEYCLMHEIEGEQREDFVWFIQRLDQLYLERGANRG